MVLCRHPGGQRAGVCRRRRGGIIARLALGILHRHDSRHRVGHLSLFMKDPPRGKADVGHAVHGLPKFSDYSQLLKIKSYVLNTLAMAAMTFAIGGISYWMPDYLVLHRAWATARKSNSARSPSSPVWLRRCSADWSATSCALASVEHISSCQASAF